MVFESSCVAGRSIQNGIGVEDEFAAQPARNLRRVWLRTAAKGVMIASASAPSQASNSEPPQRRGFRIAVTGHDGVECAQKGRGAQEAQARRRVAWSVGVLLVGKPEHCDHGVLQLREDGPMERLQRPVPARCRAPRPRRCRARRRVADRRKVAFRLPPAIRAGPDRHAARCAGPVSAPARSRFRQRPGVPHSSASALAALMDDTRAIDAIRELGARSALARLDTEEGERNSQPPGARRMGPRIRE
jgi:hypothetical protein